MLSIRNTSKYPTEEVEALVRFALADLGLDRLHVNVKNSSYTRRGYAYYYVPSISNAPKSARNLITIGIGAEHHFPYVNGYWNTHARREGKPRRGGRWPEVTLADWREAIVHVAAHEGKHIEYAREHKPQSEIRCEWYGAWALERYRESLEVAA